MTDKDILFRGFKGDYLYESVSPFLNENEHRTNLQYLD